MRELARKKRLTSQNIARSRFEIVYVYCLQRNHILDLFFKAILLWKHTHDSMICNYLFIIQ